MYMYQELGESSIGCLICTLTVCMKYIPGHIFFARDKFEKIYHLLTTDNRDIGNFFADVLIVMHRDASITRLLFSQVLSNSSHCSSLGHTQIVR